MRLPASADLGRLAVVVAGFVVGAGTLDAGYQTRLQERYVWNSVDVLLEAFVFAYIGLHLRFVLEDLREAHESLTEVAVASAVVLAIVLVIRPLSVFAMFGRGVLSRQVDRRLSVPIPDGGGRGALGTRKRSRPPGKWRSRIDNRALSWAENVVVSWTGMRGVVTLAAAQTLPAAAFEVLVVDNGSRDDTAAVVAAALLLAGGAVGWQLQHVAHAPSDGQLRVDGELPHSVPRDQGMLAALDAIVARADILVQIGRAHV